MSHPIVSIKPIKKTDKELFALIEEKINQRKYIFMSHSERRMRERHVSQLDVIYLLAGKKGYGRTRNKKKDVYESISIIEVAQDWKYCIEGCDIDGHALRVIVTFTEDLMPIITVIRI
jgi:hypothetical protein